MSFGSRGSVLPRDKGAAPLDFVIAVMAFLAALALGASLIADRAAPVTRAPSAARIGASVCAMLPKPQIRTRAPRRVVMRPAG